MQSRGSSPRKRIPNRNPSTQNRRNLTHILTPPLWNLDRRRSIKKRIFREKPIVRKPTKVLGLAKLRPKFRTIKARKTHVGRGIGADPVALLETELGLGFGAGFDDNATGFVAGDEVVFEGEGGCFAKDGGKVRVAEGCCGDFYEEIARAGSRDGDIFDLNGGSALHQLAFCRRRGDTSTITAAFMVPYELAR